jgi:V8-like Glu-specific endopeptidase
VLLNMENGFGLRLGACSGTIIAPRAVLTGAHCLDEDVSRVTVWLGSGAEIAASSFAYFANYRSNDPASRDVGVIRMGQDLPRSPIPLLTSRDAQVGETAVIAGWGRDESSVPATLRAGTAIVSAVRGTLLETQFSANGSAICSGDSGGPILLQQSGGWAVAGVISAVSDGSCNAGTNFYVNLRNAEALAFVQQHAPEAARR